MHRGPGTRVDDVLNSLSIDERPLQYDHLGQAADALDAFQKCTELNPEAIRAVMRKTELQEFLDSGTQGSTMMTVEMIDPPLDHISHTLPERRGRLSFDPEPKEINATDSAVGNRQEPRPARSAATVWNCVSQDCAAKIYICRSSANSNVDCSAFVEQDLCCTIRL